MTDPKSSTLTTKFGKGYDASWYVASGTPAQIKAQLIDFFELGSWAEDRSPAEVSIEASRLANAMFSGQQVLGATAVRDDSQRADSGASAAVPVPSAVPGADPWAGLVPVADSKPQTPAPDTEADTEPHAELLTLIGAVQSKQELTRLWHQHKQAWTDPVVAEAAKQRIADLAKAGAEAGAA